MVFKVGRTRPGTTVNVRVENGDNGIEKVDQRDKRNVNRPVRYEKGVSK